MASPVLPRKAYLVRKKCMFDEEFAETVRRLESLKNNEYKTLFRYKAWIEQREKSIRSIESLEKKLENLHQACNVANGVGSALQIVGGVAQIAGVILMACGHKNVGEFLTKKVSNVSTVTGVATTATSSITETGLTIKTMNDAKLVLENDRAYTNLLMQSLQNSKEIDSRLKRIFNCSILSDVFVHVVRLVQEGIVLLQVGHVEISHLMVELKSKLLKCNDVLDLAEKSETILQNVHSTMKRIITSRDARKAVWNICKIIQHSPLAIESIKLGLRITFQICDVLKVDVFTGALGLSLMQTSAGVMATKCLLGSVQVAVSVLTLISAVNNAKEGTSEHSKMLKELKKALIMELDAVRKDCPKLP